MPGVSLIVVVSCGDRASVRASRTEGRIWNKVNVRSTMDLSLVHLLFRVCAKKRGELQSWSKINRRLE